MIKKVMQNVRILWHINKWGISPFQTISISDYRSIINSIAHFVWENEVINQSSQLNCAGRIWMSWWLVVIGLELKAWMPHRPNQNKTLIYLLHSPLDKGFYYMSLQLSSLNHLWNSKKTTNQVFQSQAFRIAHYADTKVSQVLARSHMYEKFMRKGSSIKILSPLTEFSFAASLLDLSPLEKAVNAPSVWQFSLY